MMSKSSNSADILIVDDNPENVKILSSILKKNKYRLRAALSGKMALNSVHKRQPDLILLDIMMPETDGYEVCRQLKADEETKDIPIIFISALNDVSDKIKGLAQGAVDYITKPFHGEEVIARIKNQLLFFNMQRALKKNNDLLQQEIIERTRAENDLRKARDDLKGANQNLEQRVQEELKKRQKQQQILVQRSKLESLGKLAAGIAHEINQPLAGISMGLDNILYKIRSKRSDDAYVEKKALVLLGHIDRIKHIIEHIRIFSREQTTAVFDRIDVFEVCKNALSIINVQYHQHGISILIEKEDSMFYTLGNQYRLEQVVLNLISNARDAVEEKAKTFKASPYQKEIKISVRGNAEKIFMEVRDNGTGIPGERENKIFDPFFTTKDPEQGTGLGLSVSYGIIKEMNGNICAESKYGKYTKMKITLPRIK